MLETWSNWARIFLFHISCFWGCFRVATYSVISSLGVSPISFGFFVSSWLFFLYSFWPSAARDLIFYFYNFAGIELRSWLRKDPDPSAWLGRICLISCTILKSSRYARVSFVKISNSCSSTSVCFPTHVTASCRPTVSELSLNSRDSVDSCTWLVCRDSLVVISIHR